MHRSPLFIVALLGLLASGCSSTERTITGTFVVTDSRFFEMSAAQVCHGSFDGITFGSETRVWVAGDHGQPLAETTLGSGTATGGQCRFAFVLENVPQDWGYAIHVRAGGLTFFPIYRDDVLERDGWILEIQVGPCEGDPTDYCVVGGTPRHHLDPLPSITWDP